MKQKKAPVATTGLLFVRIPVLNALTTSNRVLVAMTMDQSYISIDLAFGVLGLLTMLAAFSQAPGFYLHLNAQSIDRPPPD